MALLYSQFGIQHFQSGGVKFSGQLKSDPNDFQVNEISLDGMVAGKQDLLNSESHPLFVYNKRRRVAESASTFASSTEVELASTLKLEPLNDWNAIRANPQLYLKRLIGEAKYKELSELSLSKKSDVTVNLGCFNEKTDRSVLHQCVRFLFPVIKSSPSKENVNTHILCAIDHLYLKLKDIGLLEDSAKQLLVYINCRLIQGTEGSTKPFNLNTSSFGKNSRKQLHILIQTQYGKFMESKTLSGESCISIRFKDRKLPAKRNKRKLQEIYSFVLQKENVELLSALKAISTELKIDVSRLRYAGIKDKKALTNQFITVSNIDFPSHLKQGLDRFGDGVKIIGSPTIVDKELQLGNLAGNHFHIIIRNVNSPGRMFYEFNSFKCQMTGMHNMKTHSCMSKPQVSEIEK